AADLDQVVGGAQGGQAFGDTVDRVPLGDAGQVKAQTSRLLDGAGFAVEAQTVPAADGAGCGDLVIRRQDGRGSEGVERTGAGRSEAPQVHQGAEGGVDRAIGV